MPRATALLLLLAACTSEVPCAKSEETHVTFVEGDGRGTMTCAGANLVLHLPASGVRWTATRNRLDVLLDFFDTATPAEGAAPTLTVAVNLPSDLPAGRYPADQQVQTNHGPIPLVAVGHSRFTVTGTVEYKRTRNYPFVDVREPARGTHTPELSLKLDLTGTAFQTCGGNFTVAPVSLELRNTLEIATCEISLFE
ncbi:MAG: hypothetical protein ACK4N5_23225 [Myxococcales bacterium]